MVIFIFYFAPCNVTWQGHWFQILPLTGFHPPLTLADPLKCCRKMLIYEEQGEVVIWRRVLLLTAQIKWQSADTWTCLRLEAQHGNRQHSFFCRALGLTVNAFFYWFTNCPGRSNVATDTMNKWCTADLCISVKGDWPLKFQYLAAGKRQM